MSLTQTSNAAKTRDRRQNGLESRFMREYRRGSLLALDIDPRIDLTKPIFEQAMKLQSKDRVGRRKRSVSAA